MLSLWFDYTGVLVTAQALRLLHFLARISVLLQPMVSTWVGRLSVTAHETICQGCKKAGLGGVIGDVEYQLLLCLSCESGDITAASARSGDGQRHQTWRHYFHHHPIYAGYDITYY
ncbi:hypothetical protein VTI74DRAFT_4663 [Chaetomium olivicolor]